MNFSLVVLSTALALCTTLSASAEDIQARFAEAPPEFSPVPIWWWSGDRVEPARIKEQLERMTAGGIHNAIILNLAPSGPLYGSAADDPPFLSEEWWDLFGFTLQEAKRVGVRLWFYDQLGFSGAGLQARVVRDHPGFRGVELRREVRDVDGPADIELRTPPAAETLAAFLAQIVPTKNAAVVANWIWDATVPEGVYKRYFRRTFELDRVPDNAHLNITCDNGYEVYVNGVKLGQESIYGAEGWSRAERFPIAAHLRPGRNVIAVAAENLGGPGGLLVEIILGDAASKRTVIPSDGDYRVSGEAPDGWTLPAFDDSSWPQAYVIGPPPQEPWPTVVGIETMPEATLGMPLRQVQDVTESVRDGVLHVAVPEGRHRVELFYLLPGGFDYQNPDAGAALLDVVHGEMERRFGDELGKGIAGSFQDEFPALPRFSRRLPEEFRRRTGYNLLERLPALYDDVTDRFGDPNGPTTIQVRCDANNVAAELCERAFFRPLHEWHEKHGLLCGYDQTVRNADPVRGERYYLDYFKTMRHYSAPGNDMDGDAKPHQSIADLYGRPRVWLEGFHSSGWGQTLEEIATLLHPWLCEGATLYDPHAIYYSIHGSYWEWAPPDTGWRQPYYVHYPVLAEYVSRLCCILSQGTHVVEVGVVHPAATVHAYTGFGEPGQAAQRAGQVYWAVQNNLRAARIDYLILDEDSIARAKVRDGKLQVGPIRFTVILLPSTRVLSGETAEKLAQFVGEGGSLVVVGEAPQFASDRTISETKFSAYIQTLVQAGVALQDPSGIVEVVSKKSQRSVTETIPALHRRIADRDFYLLLSDDGTPANGHARFAINDQKLWETPAARGARLSVTLAQDGIPELWDALSGNIEPVLNYRRAGKGANLTTRVDIELSSTPAPLVALRPPQPEDPLAIESDLEIVSWKRTSDGVEVCGLPRLDNTSPATAEHHARVALADGAYEGAQPAKDPVHVSLQEPFECRLEPTCDNHDGSFAWPPSPGPIPVETRAFRFHEEAPGEDTATWRNPGFEDSQWQTVIASFGPRAEWAGPIPLTEGHSFDTLTAPPASPEPFTPAVYSLKLGIDEDPVFASALGGKGRIPDEFIDLGETNAGDVYLVRATVTLPPGSIGAGAGLSAVLRVGSAARKRVFLNGEEVALDGTDESRVRRGSVQLRPGPNCLELLVSRPSRGRLRLFYHFLPPGSIPPDPEWIWSAQAGTKQRTRFSKALDVPTPVKSAAMVVALGDLHQIRINGELVADQGNFDPYFTSRAERYDIRRFLRQGENRIEIDARDTGHPVGLLLDGLITLEDGRELTFVSDNSFTATPIGDENTAESPARILPGPASGYMGDPANLLLRPRPHPLPFGGWLLGQPALPEPFNELVYSMGDARPRPAWYRFLVPPGATRLSLDTPGEAALFVNGQPVTVEETSSGYAANLPGPDQPTRVAAFRIASAPGSEAGAAIRSPITFEVGPGRIPLGSWDELGLPHYCGGVVYMANATLDPAPTQSVTLDLGHVRGSVDVTVNGVSCGTRLWHPYRFDITNAAKPGENRIEIRVFNTLGPHFAMGHPGAHVFANQTRSGIFGPVSIAITEPVTMRLVRVR